MAGKFPNINRDSECLRIWDCYFGSYVTEIIRQKGDLTSYQYLVTVMEKRCLNHFMGGGVDFSEIKFFPSIYSCASNNL